jgi:regulation of enolase protein 1 (concanavalin A-like superfamily)
VAPGDFTIETRVLFEPATNFQFAGLVVYQDDLNTLALGRAFCDVEGVCVGNAVYFDYIADGNWTGGNFGTSIDNPSDVYLRLERRGEMVRAFYSIDGSISWYEIGTHWIPADFQVNGVGLMAGQDYDTSDENVSAYFDYFAVTEGWGFLPEGFHDYDSGDVPNWACNAGGWAVDPDNREADVAVDIVVDDQTVASLVAGDFRQDLLDAGVCVDGKCAFSTSLWGLISSYEPHRVDAWAQDDSGDWVLLSSSAKTLTCRTYDIYIFDRQTGETRLLAALADTHEFNPRWSPDAKKIVHDRWATDWSSHGVYITDVGTGVSAPLAGAQGGSYPTWAPNNRWIAFDRGADGDNRVFIIRPTGGVPRLVAEDAFMAAWAPTSQRLAFHRPSDGSIRTKGLWGGGETLVAEHGNGPAWSPDGKWIAYELDGDVWKVRVGIYGNPLADPIQLTSSPLWEGRPTWSNNSKTIAYHAGMGQDTDIWKIPAAGGTGTWLTGAPIFGDYDPNYSFNGRYLAYSSFSPDSQAARQWGAGFSFHAGTWSEGEHNYYFETAYTFPEPGGETTSPVTFTAAGDAPWYDGYVLLRALALRARVGDECPALDPAAIRPDQPTLFHWVELTSPMTYQEAVQHFDSLTVTAYWDGGSSAGLARGEIFPWSAVDFAQYLCAAATP